jgi:hypothetical protein
MAMADAIFNAMGDALARWTMGSAAAPAASMWADTLGADPNEAELRLLALSGQFLGVAVTNEPPAELHALPDVPVLQLPIVPETLRPLLRRVLDAINEPWARLSLLRFLAARGWTIHPGDWMPAPSDEETPEIYAPWRNWAEIAASTGKMLRAVSGAITVETWNDYQPVARKMALTELRQRDASLARTLMESKLAGEDAETRLRLLSVLAVELSDADVDFLQGIVSTDRALKVKALATSLLNQLGRGTISNEDIAELKGFFKVGTKGLLRRARAIEFENATKPAQWRRRSELLESVDIAAFAGALEMTGAELIAAWPWHHDEKADYALIALIMRTGTQALVAQAAEAVNPGDQHGMQHLLSLLPRLSPDQRSELGARLVRIAGHGFAAANTVAAGVLRVDNPLATPAGDALLAAVSREGTRPSDHAAELRALGLITAQPWARRILERLNTAGLVQGDPRLDMLRLNEMLEDRIGGEKP